MSERDDIVPPGLVRIESLRPPQVAPTEPRIDEGNPGGGGAAGGAAIATRPDAPDVPRPTDALGQPLNPALDDGWTKDSVGAPEPPKIDTKGDFDIVDPLPPPPGVPDGTAGGIGDPSDEVPSETFPAWENPDGQMPEPRDEDRVDPNDEPDGVDPTDPKPERPEPFEPAEPGVVDQIEGEVIDHQEMVGDPTGPISAAERARRVAQGLPPEPDLRPPGGLGDGPIGGPPLPDYMTSQEGAPATGNEAPPPPRTKAEFGGAPVRPYPYQETSVPQPELPQGDTWAKPSEPLDHM